MLGPTGENRNDPNECMSEQREFLKWFQNTLDEFLTLKDIVTDLRTRMDKTDTSIQVLQAEIPLIIAKYDAVMSVLNEQNIELAANKTLRLRLTPLVDKIDAYVGTLKGWRALWNSVGKASFLWIVVSIFRPDLSPVVLTKILDTLIKGH